MRFVGQQPQRLFTVRRDPNVETRMPQSAGDGGSDVRVVVDHQHRAARALLRGRFDDPHADYGMEGAGAVPQRFFRPTNGWRIPARPVLALAFASQYLPTPPPL